MTAVSAPMTRSWWISGAMSSPANWMTSAYRSNPCVSICADIGEREDATGRAGPRRPSPRHDRRPAAGPPSRRSARPRRRRRAGRRGGSGSWCSRREGRAASRRRSSGTAPGGRARRPIARRCPRTESSRSASSTSSERSPGRAALMGARFDRRPEQSPEQRRRRSRCEAGRPAPTRTCRARARRRMTHAHRADGGIRGAPRRPPIGPVPGGTVVPVRSVAVGRNLLR